MLRPPDRARRVDRHTWPTTSQSKSIRIAARRSLTEGAAISAAGLRHRPRYGRGAPGRGRRCHARAPGREFARRARVGLPGVGVPDLGREEFYRPLGRLGIRGKERRQRPLRFLFLLPLTPAPCPPPGLSLLVNDNVLYHTLMRRSFQMQQRGIRSLLWVVGGAQLPSGHSRTRRPRVSRPWWRP